MPLSIKSPVVDDLVSRIVRLTGETKTEAIRRAIEERYAKLQFQVGGQDRVMRLRRLLDHEVWPEVPPEQRGRRLTREEEDAILGFGPEGT